jgi:hypothetical protein
MQILTEERSLLTLLLSACGPETTPSSAEKMQLRVYIARHNNRDGR